MRKGLAFALSIVLLLALCGCGATASQPAAKTEAPAVETDTPEPTDEPETESAEDVSAPEDTASETGSRILVVYFSRTGENYTVGTIDKGNTAIVAEMIAAETGADTFEIVPVTPYPDSYDECLDVATEEQRSNARPAYVGEVENWESYDIVFFGYPIWWGDLPMIAYTFLEGHDWNGKTVIPFNTHEGSGQSGTQQTVAELCSGAEIIDGLAVRGGTAQNDPEAAESAVRDWLGGMDFFG